MQLQLRTRLHIPTFPAGICPNPSGKVTTCANSALQPLYLRNGSSIGIAKEMYAGNALEWKGRGLQHLNPPATLQLAAG